LKDVKPSSLTGEAFTAWYAATAGADTHFAPLPAALRSLISGIILEVAPNASSLYDPYVGSGELLQLAHSTIPEASVAARADTFMDELLARLAFAVDDSQLEVQTVQSLSAEPNPSKADLVICFPPPNQGSWTDKTPTQGDPRWTLGTPPRNKANFAWIQQVISHMDVGSPALLLLCNAPLHSNVGVERQLRIALAQSGLVKTVISLPGRLFDDGRPPCSLVVLEKPAVPLAGTLFIDAQDFGVEVGATPVSPPGKRILPDDAVQKILRILTDHRSDPSKPTAREDGARFVTHEEIADAGFLLTPWTYVHPDPAGDCGSQRDRQEPQDLQALQNLRHKAQAELDAYLAELLRLVSV
jgi:type I restriction-modification system DNA methylase subunit